ncbi:hypothetical protein F2Q69_00022683 [Brassica cretica]|uniref:Uncharacterized protein n=1 Tax=Brassica cretica TaxID=69181 RepID=A0A8S9Q7B6_BRACR|nr:hypothetical protein F2Q69_00022683 [Brassica cretica]
MAYKSTVTSARRSGRSLPACCSCLIDIDTNPSDLGVLAGWSEVATIDGLSEVVATSVEVLAICEVATIDGSPEVFATSVEVLARWSEIVIAASCALVIPGRLVVAEIRASGCAMGSVTA